MPRSFVRSCGALALICLIWLPLCLAETDCEQGNGLLNFSPPKGMTTAELIQKFAAAETLAREARKHYTYSQDVLIQTLRAKVVDGEFHELTNISYDDRGKRQESVTFAEEPSLRSVQLTQEDMDDIRVFMPFMLPTEDLPQYALTYLGQQHVDDLDTYVFHIEPKKEERGHRYLEGRVWVDSRDLQIVKVCGKSVPNAVRVKKNQSQDIRANFVTYRQPIDNFWFPAYTRSDDTLQFRNASVHVHEVVKYSGYKRTNLSPRAEKKAQP